MIGPVRLLAAAAVSAAFLSAAPVQAQQFCMSRADLLAKLEEDYGEHPVAFGIRGDGAAVVELAVSPSGSWTIFVTHAGGVSCITATGESWQAIPPKSEEEPA